MNGQLFNRRQLIPLTAAFALTADKAQADNSMINEYLEAWNAHDDGTQLASLFDQEGKYFDHGNPGLEVVGRKAIAQLAADQFRAFPDLELSPLITCDDAALVMFAGTNTGASPHFNGGQPTGSVVNVATAHFLTLNDQGLIVEAHELYDGATFLSQLGL